MFRRDDVIESVWLIQKRRLIMGRRIFLGYTNLCWRKYEFAEYKMRFHGSFHASQNACLAVCLAVWVYVRVYMYVCLSVCVPICCLSTCLRVLSLCTAHLYVWISTMYVHVFRFMCSYRNAYIQTLCVFICILNFFYLFIRVYELYT